MRVKEPFTAADFEAATGRSPTQDDLDRVNCRKAGDPMHSMCGWNYKHDCPMFERTDES